MGTVEENFRPRAKKKLKKYLNKNKGKINAYIKQFDIKNPNLSAGTQAA